jgi:hypothetical protein
MELRTLGSCLRRCVRESTHLRSTHRFRFLRRTQCSVRSRFSSCLYCDGFVHLLSYRLVVFIQRPKPESYTGIAVLSEGVVSDSRILMTGRSLGAVFQINIRYQFLRTSTALTTEGSKSSSIFFAMDDFNLVRSRNSVQ